MTKKRMTKREFLNSIRGQGIPDWKKDIMYEHYYLIGKLEAIMNLSQKQTNEHNNFLTKMEKK
jgi:hypothetical protein